MKNRVYLNNGQYKNNINNEVVINPQRMREGFWYLVVSVIVSVTLQLISVEIEQIMR